MAKSQFNVAVLGYGLSGSTFHAPLITTTPGLRLTHFLSRQQGLIKVKYPEIRV